MPPVLRVIISLPGKVIISVLERYHLSPIEAPLRVIISLSSGTTSKLGRSHERHRGARLWPLRLGLRHRARDGVGAFRHPLPWHAPGEARRREPCEPAAVGEKIGLNLSLRHVSGPLGSLTFCRQNFWACRRRSVLLCVEHERFCTRTQVDDADMRLTN